MPRTDHCAASVASCPPKPRSLGVWTFRCAGIQSEVSRFLGVSLRRFQVFCHKSERGARAKLGRNMVAQAATASAAELTSSADSAEAKLKTGCATIAAMRPRDDSSPIATPRSTVGNISTDRTSSTFQLITETALTNYCLI